MSSVASLSTRADETDADEMRAALEQRSDVPKMANAASRVVCDHAEHVAQARDESAEQRSPDLHAA